MIIGYFVAIHFGGTAAIIFYAVTVTIYRLIAASISGQNDWAGGTAGQDSTWNGSRQETYHSTIGDDYAVLGLTPDATDIEVRNAYRRLAMRWHPDVCQEADAATHFRTVCEAYKSITKQRGMT